jgi:hypothetical protein
VPEYRALLSAEFDPEEELDEIEHVWMEQEEVAR